VQPVADEHVLDLAEVAVDVQQEVVELLVARRLVDVQVVVQLRCVDELPDLPADGRQLAGSIACTWAYSSSSCSSCAISS
jgi:hypothetical protein